MMKRLIGYSLSLSCFLFSVIPLLHPAVALSAPFAPGLRVRVLDPAGDSIRGARVRLFSRDGLQWTAVTDDSGICEFARVRSGDYLLDIEAPGFRQQVMTLRVTGAEDQTVEVTLSAAGVREELVVTPSGTPQSVDEAAKSISVVSADEIERRNEYSLIESLRPAAGVRTVQLGGPGGFSKIFVRGLRVADTSLLLDGLRVRDAADFRGSANPLLEDILVTNVERIEVLRGSGSSLYGSHAVGGVINIVPAGGGGPFGFDLGFEGGSMGFFREHAQLSGGTTNLDYSVAATRLDVTHGVHGQDVFRTTSLGGRIHYTIAPSAHLRGTVHFSDGMKRLSESPFPIGPPGNEFGFATGNGPVAGWVENQPDPDSFRDGRMFVGSVVFSGQVGGFYGYSASFQSVVTDRIFDDGPAQSARAKDLGLFEFPSIFRSDGRIETFNVTNTIRAGRTHLVSLGIEVERESYTQEFQSPGFSTPATTDRQRSLAFFAQNQARFFDGRFQVATSFRTQSFSLRNPQSVPEVQNIPIPRAYVGDGSIAYSVARTGTKFRAHVGNSFRAPSLSERFSTFRGQRVGNPFLRPERALSLDGGLDQILWGGKVRASATYFYTRLQEVIVSTALFRTVNARGALARGFEFSLEASPSSGLVVNAAYTYANSAQVLPGTTLLADNRRLPSGASLQSFSIPRHTFSLEVNRSFRRGLNITFDFISVSRHNFPLFDPLFFSQVIFPFDGYFKADLGASFTRAVGERWRVTLYGKVDNLFDRRIIEEGFRAPGAVGIGGIKFQF
ncbi:MAG TPA: TonB-dependent receptor [Blastocatellia bacterium]|nr:TonB-dependent receptor [Blastocatellia bacterium]